MSKTKSEDQKRTVVHAVKLGKSTRQQAERALVTRNGTKRGYLRSMTEATANYESWRRDGFKGAWWWQYFKRAEAA